MYIPVEFRARVELRVDRREEVAAQGGRDVLVRDVVERIGERYLVVVQGERAQVQSVGEGLDIFDEVFRPLERKGVVHSGGRNTNVTVVVLRSEV